MRTVLASFVLSLGLVQASDWKFSGSFENTLWLSNDVPPAFLEFEDGYFLDPRLSLTVDYQPDPRFFLHATLRADQGFDPGTRPDGDVRLDELILRYRPFGDSQLNLQLGKFPTVVGNWVPTHNYYEDPFILAPLPYTPPSTESTSTTRPAVLPPPSKPARLSPEPPFIARNPIGRPSPGDPPTQMDSPFSVTTNTLTTLSKSKTPVSGASLPSGTLGTATSPPRPIQLASATVPMPHGPLVSRPATDTISMPMPRTFWPLERIAATSPKTSSASIYAGPTTTGFSLEKPFTRSTTLSTKTSTPSVTTCKLATKPPPDSGSPVALARLSLTKWPSLLEEKPPGHPTSSAPNWPWAGASRPTFSSKPNTPTPLSRTTSVSQIKTYSPFPSAGDSKAPAFPAHAQALLNPSRTLDSLP